MGRGIEMRSGMADFHSLDSIDVVGVSSRGWSGGHAIFLQSAAGIRRASCLHAGRVGGALLCALLSGPRAP